MFIINCKNYEEIAGNRILKFIKTVEKIAVRYKVPIGVAPPQHMLALLAQSKIPIIAQHVDNVKVGSTTGHIVPELLKKSKISGSLINHSEHRISGKEVASLIDRLRNLNMISVVCVKNVAEVKKYSTLYPDYIAIEPPELIGSGKAVSKEKPDLILKASKILNNKNKTQLLCGAGIVSGDDVSSALDLGARGILVASGIIKAKNWDKKISEFAKAML